MLGADSRAALTLGFIPARFSGGVEIYPAVPAWLTPLSSTIVHGGALHLALNMLMLVWCGTKVERMLGTGRRCSCSIRSGPIPRRSRNGSSSPLSPTPMIGASGADQRSHRRVRAELWPAEAAVSSPSLNRMLNALWLLAAWVVLQMMTGLLAGMQGYPAGDAGAYRRLRRRAAAAAPVAAVALPEGLGG